MKTLKKILISGSVICILFSITSCSRNGYGCKGNQSWDKMIKRNNKP